MPDVGLSLAPTNLSQVINPWQFNLGSLFTVNVGQSSDPDMEKQVLDEVGSYGRQLGQMGDVMKILLGLIDQTKLTDDQRKAIHKLEFQLDRIDAIKADRQRAKGAA